MAREVCGRNPRGAGRPTLRRELVVVAAAVLAYFAVRGVTAGDPAPAVRNAHALVEWEIRYGIYLEPAIQGLVEHSWWLTAAMNWMYIWGHWPVITVTLIWLVRHHPAGYRVTRNAMLASGAIGLGVFAVYPLAPPRLADLGLVDTVSEYSTSYRVLQPNALVNQYAAMPSLHVGWDLLIGLALITYSRRRIVRIAGALLPVGMVAAVLTTANHYVIDAVVGIGLVTVCLLLARRFERRRHGPVGPVPAAAHIPAQRTGAEPGPIPEGGHARDSAQKR